MHSELFLGYKVILISGFTMCGIYVISLSLTSLENSQVLGDEAEGALCSFTAFRERMSLDPEAPVLPVELLAGCTHVLNNRVPTTASRTTRHVLGRAATLHHVHHAISDQRTNQGFYIKPPLLKNFTRQLETAGSGVMLTSHVYFYEFLPGYREKLLYINVVREPADWFVSAFTSAHQRMEYWQSRDQLDETEEDAGFISDISACIASSYCWQQYNRSALHFLCGHDEVCRNHSEASYCLAHKHLMEDYLVVGLMEKLGDYFEVLEYLLPHIYSKATQIYKTIQESYHLRTQQTHKFLPSVQDYNLLKSKIVLDYRLYKSAADRLEKMVHAVRVLKARIRNTTSHA